jgi:hypothetical protein
MYQPESIGRICMNSKAEIVDLTWLQNVDATGELPDGCDTGSLVAQALIVALPFCWALTEKGSFRLKEWTDSST